MSATRQFRQVVTKCEVEQSRFDFVAKPFAEYFTEQKFDLLYSRHAWYYAHSDSELRRAMESLRAGGEFLITMWCEGSAIWRQCRDLGQRDEARLDTCFPQKRSSGAHTGWATLCTWIFMEAHGSREDARRR